MENAVDSVENAIDLFGDKAALVLAQQVVVVAIRSVKECMTLIDSDRYTNDYNVLRLCVDGLSRIEADTSNAEDALGETFWGVISALKVLANQYREPSNALERTLHSLARDLAAYSNLIEAVALGEQGGQDAT